MESKIYNKIYRDLNNIEFLRHNLTPSLPYSSISLAVLNFYVDISRSRDPVQEYFHLKNCIYSYQDYQPLDPEMRKLWNQDNKIFNIDHSFNPNFPYEFYHKIDFNHLLLSYGLIEYSSEFKVNTIKIYELLVDCYPLGRFYNMILPGNKITYITLEQVESIPREEVISFGTLDSSDNFTCEELYNCFETTGYFANPKTLEPWNDREVHSLLYCLATSKSVMKSKLIELINRKRDLIDQKESELKELLIKLPVDILEEAFTLLLEIGMTMRGWESGSYLLKSIEVVDDGVLYLKVWNSINKFRKFIKLKKLKAIELLPIFSFKNGTFVQPERRNGGKTIGDRLRIVTEEEYDNEEACIRTSSNYFCHTAYKYLIMIGCSSPYDITEITIIH